MTFHNADSLLVDPYHRMYIPSYHKSPIRDMRVPLLPESPDYESSWFPCSLTESE